MQSLILVGYRGTGKTSLGKRLAKIAGLPFTDTDALIVRRAGTVSRRYSPKRGRLFFRNLESSALASALESGPSVVATGGGIILREENRALIRTSGFTVWLTADAEELYRRIHRDTNRPALTQMDPLAEIKALLNFRNPLYEAVACCTVDTTRIPFAKAAQDIADRWIAEKNG